MCGNVHSEYKIGRFVKIVQERSGIQKNRREDIQAPSFFSYAELEQEYIKQIQTTNPLPIDLCAQQQRDIGTFLSSIRGTQQSRRQIKDCNLISKERHIQTLVQHHD
ncbi:MAG: hypothetical protein EZS28_003660 [Streblomastix strix]|uniref:Uncharacterized protein n=1 Tax=Streblomastix strix TaxID=222440 RepID=A0A5J4X2W9_9EUKA|nr:MAG: hypothetical protein EZS28_003660 [Streblomastix strix]